MHGLVLLASHSDLLDRDTARASPTGLGFAQRVCEFSDGDLDFHIGVVQCETGDDVGGFMCINVDMRRGTQHPVKVIK